MEKIGIENLTKVVVLGLDLGKAGYEASQASGVIEKAKSFFPLVEDLTMILGLDLKSLKDEMLDLSPEETEQLKATVVAKFSIKDELLEHKIEGSIGIVLDLVSAFKNAMNLWQA